MYHRQWYWLADLCEEHGIEFVLGHALYMRAIYGAKTRNSRLELHLERTAKTHDAKRTPSGGGPRPSER